MKINHSLMLCAVLHLLVFTMQANAQNVYGTRILVDIPEYYLDSNWSGHLFPKYAVMYQAIYHTKLYPVWSPDGKWIVFSDGKYGIWKVSVNGGKPELLLDNYDVHYWKGKPVTINGLMPLCFFPGGDELIYMRNTINEEEGTEVRIDDSGSIVELRYPYPVIESINLVSGARRQLAENALSGYLSRDGRYFAYIFKNDIRYNSGDIAVYDNEKDDDWLLGVDANSLCITPDNSYVIFSGGDEGVDSPLYRIPLNGGPAEQITFFDQSYDFKLYNGWPDCSPDGEWIVFHGTFQFETSELFALNSFTGELIEIFPYANVPVYDPLKEYREFSMPKFAPGGRQLCYVMTAEDYQYSLLARELYLVDFDLESRRPGIVESNEPSSFEILGNYPNPFNQSSTITFSLPVAGFIELVIYDVTGQKVCDLVSGSFESGVHSAVWDGIDNFGYRVSSGLYLSRLSMKDRNAGSAMMLVK